MSFPALYNEVTHVSIEPTTVPTAAVLTHVLHLPADKPIDVCTYLLYLLLYQLYAHVQYLLLSSTYYVLTYSGERTNCIAHALTYTYF